MASIAPFQAYISVPFALTGASATDVYTVGDEGERGANLIGVMVSDPTGSVSTPAKVVWYKISNTTEYVLVPTAVGLPTPAENLVFVCEPAIRLKVGDEIRVTGASGHHVVTTFVPIGLDSRADVPMFAQAAGRPTGPIPTTGLVTVGGNRGIK